MRTADGPAWVVFPEVMVRAAGLPYDLWDALRTPRTAELAREAQVIGSRMARAAPSLLGLLAAERRRRPAAGGRGDLRLAERCVRRRRAVAEDVLPPPGDACVRDWNRVVELLGVTLAELRTAWARESESAEAGLAALLQRADIREAIFLNSPDALYGVQRLGRAGLKEKRQGYVRRTLVRYVQRLAAKTETGSFFGPINYGQASASEPRNLTVEICGDGKTARRRAGMSFWAAQTLADRYAAEPACAPIVRAYRGTGAPYGAELDDASRRLVDLADGTGTVAEIATAAGLSPDDALRGLRDLERRGALRLGLWIPAASRDPLAALVELLRGADGAAGERIRAELDWWRDWLASWSCGPLAEKERLLPEAEQRFTAETGQPPRRGHGRFSGDRFVVTEEATGNIAGCRIGGDLLDRVTRGLSTVLDVLGSHAVERRIAQRISLEPALARLAGGDVAVADLPPLEPLEPGPSQRWLPRWQRLVPDAARREVRLSREALETVGLIRPDLEAWPLFSAPDVMIAARDADAVNAGEYDLILSETHHLLPPASLPFAAHHPGSDAVLARLRRELEALVAPATPALQAVWRRNKAMDFIPFGQPVVCLDWMRAEPAATPIPVHELEIDLSDRARPVVRWPGAGGAEIAVVPDYPDMEPELGALRALAVPEVGTVPVVLGAHTPRIVIDGVVFQRERWALDASALPDLGGAARSPEAFSTLWRWKEEHGLPDLVFVSFPCETKPVLVDFASALSCEVFLHMLRQTRSIMVTEMLPAPDQLWLRHGGHAFCCELRLTLLRSAARREPSS